MENVGDCLGIEWEKARGVDGRFSFGEILWNPLATLNSVEHTTYR